MANTRRSREWRIIPRPKVFNFKVDTVNGKKLATPTLVRVDAGQFTGTPRYVFKCYETFSVVGVAPAVNEARKEERLPPMVDEYNPGPFRLSYHFVTLVMVSPKDASKEAALEPKEALPKGPLGFLIGTYLTIEGVNDNTTGVKSLLNFKVDTVNGKRLETPVFVQVSKWPNGLERHVLKGYETLRHFGVPDAIRQGRVEAGLPPYAEMGMGYHIGYTFNTLSMTPKERPAFPQLPR